MEAWEIRWSRNTFDMMSLNGTWPIPRSGLILRKVSEEELSLDAILPWSEDMGKGAAYGFSLPPTKENLLEVQRADFVAIALRFEAAGIRMTDPKDLLKRK